MEKLYYIDSYIKDFTAEIIEVIEKDNTYHVCLDKTAFFPGGGGQYMDKGFIGNEEVMNTYELNDKIYHVLNKKPIKIHKVKCSIDWDYRLDGMHQHTGQHILSGCFYELFKQNTVGFHLGSEISTVDIEGSLTKEQLEEVELYANKIIRENISIETLTPNKKELKKMWIRRDLPSTAKEIRVLRIEDLDINACCGVHLKSTLDLRMIKIRKVEKSRNATRVEFLAGDRAIKHCLKRDNYLSDICKYLSSKEEEAITGIKRLHENLEIANKEKRLLEEAIIEYEIKDMILNSHKIKNISIITKIYEDKDVKYLSKMSTKITTYENVISLLATINEDKVNLVFACSKDLENINMGSLLRDCIILLDGKGGGSKTLAQGGGKNNGNINSSLEYILTKLEREM